MDSSNTEEIITRIRNLEEKMVAITYVKYSYDELYRTVIYNHGQYVNLSNWIKIKLL